MIVVADSSPPIALVNIGKIQILVFAALLQCVTGHCAEQEVVFQERIIPAPEPLSVPMKIGRRSTLLILDTGFWYQAVEPSLRPPHSKTKNRQSIDAFGTPVAAEMFTLPAASIGHWRLPPSDAITTDFSGLRKVSGIPLEGILGSKALQKVAIDINFDQRRLRFIEHFKEPKDVPLYDSGKEARGGAYLPITFDREEFEPMLPLSLEGVAVNAEIDTGSDDCIGLRHEIFEKLVAVGAIVSTNNVTGSASVTAAGFVQSFAAGRFTRGELLGVNLKGYSVCDTVDTNILGMYFLINFNFVVDFPGGKFYFAKRNVELRNGQRETLGLLFRYAEGHCYVTNVDSESDAPHAGIRRGDRVLKLGPLNEKELNMASIYELCQEQAGETIEVSLARFPEQKAIKTRLLLRNRSPSKEGDKRN